MQPTADTDASIPPSVRAAMIFLRLADLIRTPIAPDSATPVTGRELSIPEQNTERAALAMLQAYFELNLDAMQEARDR